MYFWNVKALSEDLKTRTMSQREKMKYFLAFMVIGVIVTANFFLSFGSSEEINIILIIEDFITIVITVGGIILCYKANQAGDDFEFIDRFICLSLPITIRLTVLLFISYGIYMIIGYHIFGTRFDDTLERTTIIDFIIVILAEALYYLWIRSYILKISGAVNK